MRKASLLGLCLLAISVVGLIFINIENGKNTLIIKNGTLIDGKGNPAVKNSIIIIKNDKLKKISTNRNIRFPLFTKTINAKGQYIIPGLIDMHVHFSDESFCKLFLLNGVTTVRDMGNDPEFILPLRNKINKGEIEGPKIFASGYLINNRKIPFGAGKYTKTVRNPKQARKRVDQLAKKGVDCIKIYMTLPQKLTRIVISEAKKHKLPVAGHIRRTDARFAAKFGITTLEHATGIAEALSKNQKFEDAPPFQTISHRSWIYADKSKYDSLINLFIKKNVYITANLTLYKIFVSNPEEIANNSHLRFMPEQYKKRWKHHLSGRFQKVIRQKESWIITKKRLEEFLIRFKNKGGKVLAGTDAPYPYLIPGFSLHRELELLVQSGLTPMEALQTATKYPAEALHQENNLGTIEEGKTANLILLDANPLEDIRNTEKINIVIKEGIIIDREKLKRSLLGKS